MGSMTTSNKCEQVLKYASIPAEVYYIQKTGMEVKVKEERILASDQFIT